MRRANRTISLRLGLILFSLNFALAQNGFTGKEDGESLPTSEATSSDSGRRIALRTIAADPNYLKILSQLSEKTGATITQIDLDLSAWASSNQLGMTHATMLDFLADHYQSNSAPTESSWPLELNQLKTVHVARMFFDGDRAFIRSDMKVRSGSYKQVLRVKYPSDPSEQEFALAVEKPPTPGRDLDPLDVAEKHLEALNEAKMITTIDHYSQGRSVPGLLLFKECSANPITGSLRFLSEFYNRGDAHHYINEKQKIHPRTTYSISSPELISVAAQLLMGLSFLHEHAMVHRDIKPLNILLRSQPNGHLEAALADFGSGYKYDEPGIDEFLDHEDFFKTTHRYAAPEAIEKYYLKSFREDPKLLDEKWNTLKISYLLHPALRPRWIPEWSHFQSDSASDAWSLGVSLLEMSTDFDWSSVSWKANQESTEEHLTDFLNIRQSDIDSVFMEIAKSWKGQRRSAMLPTLKCLLTVDPESRCKVEEARELLEEEVRRVFAPFQKAS